MGDGNIRVLVVDDDPVCRLALRRALEKAGLKVQDAADVASACESIETGGADVMVLDYQLGDETGLHVWEYARQSNSNLARRTIMLTGVLDAPERMQMSDSTQIPVMGKPFDGEILAHMVTRLAGE